MLGLEQLQSAVNGKMKSNQCQMSRCSLTLHHTLLLADTASHAAA
jgi:hypothetical protein